MYLNACLTISTLELFNNSIKSSCNLINVDPKVSDSDVNDVIAVLGVSANDKNCCEDSNNSFKATRATIRTDHESLRRQ